MTSGLSEPYRVVLSSGTIKFPFPVTGEQAQRVKEIFEPTADSPAGIVARAIDCSGDFDSLGPDNKAYLYRAAQRVLLALADRVRTP